jgi:Sulfotransferase family
MWKAFRPISALAAQIRRNGFETVEQNLPTPLGRPSREDIVHGYRLILGREPEGQSVIDAHMLIPSVAEFRRLLLSSDEFKGKYKAIDPDKCDHPSLSMGRDTLVFIHMQKTGGTSLNAMIERQYPAHRRCPVREDKLHLLSVAELGRYDFFSGHFDQSSIRFIPRDKIKTVALFREPRARLISFYRFLKSHPVHDEFAHDIFMRLANESTAEEFFERPETRSLSAVYNHYLIALGISYSRFDHNRALLSKQDFLTSLEDAKRHIRALTALGITERFDQSAEYIWGALNMGPPPLIEMAHVTDKFPDLDARFRRVDPVNMTPRLAAALEDLTVYDDELYRFAVGEFERRCIELNVIVPPRSVTRGS